jgi:protein-S-isoprenylcysteine O-methyltransferase Ste14
MRLLALIYGLVAYVAMNLSLLYLVVFLGYFVVPQQWREPIYTARIGGFPIRSIDAEGSGRADDALLTDALLLLAFVVPHSLMARDGFKRVWTRIVPRPIERSTYVLISAALLIALFTFWKPIPEMIWPLPGTLLAGTDYQWRPVFQTLYWFGWLLALGSGFLIDHFDLTGLKQVWAYFRGREYTSPGFKTPWLYRRVRHPTMLGMLIAFWATPVMTLGHLLFAVVMSAYILVGISLEERSLIAAHGESYLQYQQRTSMLLPLRWRRS